ncbi:MAG: cytochrome c [Proteobacteria bacterium]|nr:cytochrome c [Pseudomonadota bacterium]
MQITRLIFLASCLLAWAAASADSRTVNDAVYSKAQAKVGEKLYADHCILCHDRKYFRPVLKRWEGQPLSILFTVMSTSMPESNPGFLTEKEYVDILAYILSLSRYAPGDAELDYQDGALNEITVAARQRK